MGGRRDRATLPGLYILPFLYCNVAFFALHRCILQALKGLLLQRSMSQHIENGLTPLPPFCSMSS